MNKYVIEEIKRKKLGDFLKKSREEKKLGMNQLAVKIDVTTSLLHRLENGQTQKISPFLLKEVARGLKINYKELYKIVGYLDEEKIIKVGNIDLNNPVTDFKEIPVYSSISAGYGSVESAVVSYIPLPQTNGFKGDVIGIKVDGNSMEPDIKNGDTVLIKKEIMPENNEVGAFILNNEGLLKRYKLTDRGATILSSDNKDYDPIIITESDEFVIVGKKVGVFNH